MALGPVNSQGSDSTDLEAIRTLAQNANETANAARNAAGTAQGTAEAALEAANAATSAAGEAKTTAEQALETANAAATTAGEAKTAADTALETANSVSGKADQALTAAKQAQETADAASQAVTKLTSSINAVPSQSGALTYTGSAQSPTWNSYDTEKLTISGTTSGTNAGTYTAKFTPKDGYEWSDGTTDAKSVTWTIGKATVALPTQSGTLTYTGSAQSPSWSGYDSTKLTLGGTTSGTNAGSYNASFTPTANYCWSDGTSTEKTAPWSIGKAAGSITLNPTSLTLDVSSLSKTVAVTRPGDGTVTASSSNTSIATVSVSGTTITVTGKAKGTATITVNVAASTNYTAPSSKTLSVTVDLPSTTLADNTPATIQAAAKAGTGKSYWAVGDKIGIALSGTVGSLSLSGTYYAFILGFDHNSSVEGTGIHFQFGKTSAGVDIAFVDSLYGSYDTTSTNKFKMNTTNTNSGGWKSSTMRTARCAEFLSAMPSAWQSVIASCTKYSDNTGGGSDTASYVTSTSDKIWLLAEYEVFGTRTGANSAEQNYQKQYEYYANGNSKIKYKHSDTGTACIWRLRSVNSTNATSFRYVNTGGGSNNNYACYSYGFAPGLKVA
jgi:hypothetical protein